MSGIFKDSRVNGLVVDVGVVKRQAGVLKGRVDGHCEGIKGLKEKVKVLEAKNEALEKKMNDMALEWGAVMAGVTGKFLEMSKLVKAVKRKVDIEVTGEVNKLDREMVEMKKEQVFLANKYDEVVYRSNKKRKAEVEEGDVKKVKVKIEGGKA